ncbi:MAG TPA: hypothetical protein VIU46_01995 [Gallionellaceae bacterium]
MSDTIELVRFRLNQGKTAADWLKANEKINDWMKAQPGFRFRSVSETADGEWWDLVYWESLEAAHAAGEKFMPAMGTVCAPLVAPGSVVVTRSKAHVMQQG